jgi:mono/diheme cytochrome c family protein
MNLRWSAGVIVMACALWRPAGDAAQRNGNAVARLDAVPVMPVEGPSTLHHLGRTIERSSMGWGGEWGSMPSHLALVGPRRRIGETTGAFLMSGADIYRISCRPCHRPDGTGAPPEINSILGPVQSASAVWMTARMKERGRPADSAFIRQLTASTEADLQKRLKTGGHSMPSFDHLSTDEIAVLRPYLDQLAEVRVDQGGEREIRVEPDRVGELIVKGTCHICHDAVGTDEPITVLSGVIPSLERLQRQFLRDQFVQKVRQGGAVPLGSSGVMSRGRMPIFSYLSADEVAATYSYLTRYPPRTER